MFTPLPPARSGTADYAAELIPHLAEHAELSVFQSVPRSFRARQFDQVVYQIGNNPHHSDVYRLALDEPGIVALHEANLHHLVQALTLHSGDTDSYIKEVLFEIYGPDAELNLSDLPAVDYPQHAEFTMIRRLTDSAKGFIVHSGHAAWLLRLKGFSGPIKVIPHGSSIRPSKRELYRSRLGVDSDELIVGVFGYQRPSKQETLALPPFVASGKQVLRRVF